MKMTQSNNTADNSGAQTPNWAYKVLGGSIAAAGLLGLAGMFSTAGDVMNKPYADHPEASMLQTRLTKPGQDKEKADACAVALKEGKQCTAEGAQLLVKRTENEGKLNAVFLHVPAVALITLFGFAVAGYKRKEETVEKKADAKVEANALKA